MLLAVELGLSNGTRQQDISMPALLVEIVQKILDEVHIAQLPTPTRGS